VQERFFDRWLTGDRDGALAILDEKRAWLPLGGQHNTRGSWLMLALVIEGLVMLGEHSCAGQLYPLVGELVDTGAVALLPICRFTHTVAGIAAAAARQWEAAQDHFRIALRQAESFPHRLEQAEIRRFHAMMLTDRAAQEIAKKRERYSAKHWRVTSVSEWPATSRWWEPSLTHVEHRPDLSLSLRREKSMHAV
jgi:hypothetical protein